jgi:alkanesulfonate monooxygenase SsuD/methylene tetrahydromethanopterin reductase-like flavin-dependent oxidoreductase (luciferase family)
VPPYLGTKYKSYGSWGQDKALPPGDSLDVAFEELVKNRFIIGDPDDCGHELRRHVTKLGANCFIFRVQWPGIPQAQLLRSIALLADRVMPALRTG